MLKILMPYKYEFLIKKNTCIKISNNDNKESKESLVRSAFYVICLDIIYCVLSIAFIRINV